MAGRACSPPSREENRADRRLPQRRVDGLLGGAWYLAVQPLFPAAAGGPVVSDGLAEPGRLCRDAERGQQMLMQLGEFGGDQAGFADLLLGGQPRASVATPPFRDSRAPPRPLPPRPGTPNVASQVWLTLTPTCRTGRRDLPDPPAIGAHLQASQSGCSVAGDLTQPESDQHKVRP